MRTLALVGVLVFAAAIIFNGCGKKEGDEPTKYVSQAGLEQLTKQAAQGQAAATQSGANNPKFSSFKDRQPASPAVKNLDAVIRPVLVKQFGQAKLIEENNEPVTRRDGEVILNSMKYVVGKILNEPNVRQMHTAFANVNFKPSIRTGRKPTITKTWAVMSFFKRTAGVQYTLIYKIDFKNQTITVESYKLSKHDHLM
ncbi:MAG: hypothetical protein FJZ10_04975 [Candidatus Omnitrophica bacterium]|nr:hypothetical protein [Candidatus Omnitrophota bacterium]